MKKEHKPVYMDLADLEEDQRIDQIGHIVTAHQKTAAVIVDSDPGKADRYIRKLLERFPGIEVLEKVPGPVSNTITVKVGPKK